MSWNIKLNVHKDLNKRKNAWDQINAASDNRFTVKFPKLQWKNSRDAFRRCITKREQLTRSGSGHSKLPSCKYFNNLLFLKDSLVPVSTGSNFTNEDEDDISLSIEVQEQSPSPSGTLHHSTPAKSMTSSKKSRKDDLQGFLTKSLQKVDEQISNIAQESKKEDNMSDSDFLFCVSLVHRLKTLPPRKNRLARMKIEQLLFEIEYGDNE